ncbi:MAG: glutamine synthetase type III, partial [Lachnospiraceae bacterium]|nr:glutamine synthetase type III [Lachnospiraceae bacterium]
PGCKADMKLIKLLGDSYDRIFELTQKLEEDIKKAEETEDSLKQATFYHDVIISDMNEIREAADSVEVYIPAEYLPYPKYDEILFYI